MNATRATRTPARLAASAVTALALAASAPAHEAGGATVHWRNQNFSPTECPSSMPAGARARVQEWAEWAEDYGYRMDLDEGSRVLSICNARFNRSVRREAELIEDTLAAFDTLVGPPIPLPTETRAARPGEVAVIVRLRNAEDYSAWIEHVARMAPEVKPQLVAAQDAPGVRLWQPVCSAWIDDDLGREEWRADNTLVHEVATMVSRSRFGEVPHWLEKGVAWNVEQDVCRTIYAFPGRDGFVGVAEHKGWERSLKKVLEDREGDLTMDDLAGWKRGTWDEDRAGFAWGMVRFLDLYRPGQLGPLLEDLGSYNTAMRRSVRSDLSDGQAAGYPTPASVQAQTLRRWGGDELFADLTEFLRSGSRYRPTRR